MPFFLYRILLFGLVLLVIPLLYAQSKTNPSDKFRQLEELLPTPTEYRAASGAPGSKYWQQRAGYKFDVEFDDAKQRIKRDAAAGAQGDSDPPGRHSESVSKPKQAIAGVNSGSSRFAGFVNEETR